MAERYANKIIEGLNEVVEWAQGGGRLLVSFPGGKPQLMSREEYDAERAKRRLPPAPAALVEAEQARPRLRSRRDPAGSLPVRHAGAR